MAEKFKLKSEPSGLRINENKTQGMVWNGVNGERESVHHLFGVLHFTAAKVGLLQQKMKGVLAFLNYGLRREC